MGESKRNGHKKWLRNQERVKEHEISRQKGKEEDGRVKAGRQAG